MTLIQVITMVIKNFTTGQSQARSSTQQKIIIGQAGLSFSLFGPNQSLFVHWSEESEIGVQNKWSAGSSADHNNIFDYSIESAILHYSTKSQTVFHQSPFCKNELAFCCGGIFLKNSFQCINEIAFCSMCSIRPIRYAGSVMHNHLPED